MSRTQCKLNILLKERSLAKHIEAIYFIVIQSDLNKHTSYGFLPEGRSLGPISSPLGLPISKLIVYMVNIFSLYHIFCFLSFFLPSVVPSTIIVRRPFPLKICPNQFTLLFRIFCSISLLLSPFSALHFSSFSPIVFSICLQMQIHLSKAFVFFFSVPVTLIHIVGYRILYTIGYSTIYSFWKLGYEIHIHIQFNTADDMFS